MRNRRLAVDLIQDIASRVALSVFGVPPGQLCEAAIHFGGDVGVDKIEAFRDVVAEGQDGFLVNYMRPDVASQTLVRVAGLPVEWRAQLSAQAKIRASQFDWADALPKFEEVYRTVLTT